jgi:hypothetical protein
MASIVIQPLAAKTDAGPLGQVLSFIRAASQPGTIVPAAVTMLADGHRAGPYGAWALGVPPATTSRYAYFGALEVKASPSTWAGVYVFAHAPAACSARASRSAKLAAQIDQILRATAVHAAVQ